MMTLAVFWITEISLSLQEKELISQEQDLLEENMRLALWRIDSSLNIFVREENARPYSDYYSDKPSFPFNTDKVDLYFEVTRKKGFSSPLLKSDTKDLKKVEQKLLNYDHALACAVQEKSPPENKSEDMVKDNSSKSSKSKAKIKIQQKLSLDDLNDNTSQKEELLKNYQAKSKKMRSKWGNSYSSQSDKNLNDLGARYEVAEDAYQSRSPSSTWNKVRQNTISTAWESDIKQELTQIDNNIETNNLNNSHIEDLSMGMLENAEDVLEGVLKPVWHKGELFLLRLVRVDEEYIIQGMNLNMEKLTTWVQDVLFDLFPNVELTPIYKEELTKAGEQLEENFEQLRQLALLPIRLEPEISSFKSKVQLLTPLNLSVLLIWTCLIIAILVAFFLIRATLSLSERRGAFASAVTHELRTPLTTFKMYTEMLDEGMIKSEEKQKEYFGILRKESQRLGGLVENVLSFTRLEKAKNYFHKEEITINLFLSQVLKRSEERAENEGIDLCVINKIDTEKTLYTDVASVEQIIFNLVENACKYAKNENLKVEIKMECLSKKLQISVCDNGPGVDKKIIRKLFEPFCKSDQEAADTALGVGLGLALCRALARHLGGDLRYKNQKRGACFILKIPV